MEGPLDPELPPPMLHGNEVRGRCVQKESVHGRMEGRVLKRRAGAVWLVPARAVLGVLAVKQQASSAHMPSPSSLVSHF